MSYSFGTKHGTMVASGATAAAAIALLITPAPAQARPEFECYKQAGYQFPGGKFVINYLDVGGHTDFDAPRGITVDAPAETFYDNGTSLKGRVTGTIDKGGNWIRLTVDRGSKYPPLLLTGAVQPDNTAAGNLTYENHDSQSWDSPIQLACIPGPPVEDRPVQAPAPQQPAPEAPKPVGNTPPTEAQAAPPAEAPPAQEAAPPAPNEPCIPDPFELNFPGAC